MVLQELNRQCATAQKHFPNAIVLGIVYPIRLFNTGVGESIEDYPEPKLQSSDPQWLDKHLEQDGPDFNELSTQYSKVATELHPGPFFSKIADAMEKDLSETEYDWVMPEKVVGIWTDTDKRDTEMASPAGLCVSVGIAAREMRITRS